MATTFIPINTGQRLGQQLRGFIDQLARCRDLGVQLMQVMATQVDDPAAPTNFTVLEQQFGLQAGDGVKVYTLMSGLSALNGAPLNAVCHEMG